jgi:hypothetical protein
MKAELVFLLDKIGMARLEDGKDKKIIDLNTMDNQTICHRASRNMKDMSTITCINVGGESLVPYIMMSQDFEPLHRKPMSGDVRLGVDFVLRRRLKPYVNGRLFSRIHQWYLYPLP